MPMSSSQTKSSAIMGVGASKRLSNVNWNTAKNLVLSWILTFPGCALISFIFTNLVLIIFK